MNFSIITPTFRQLDWLRLCIASVRDQVGGQIQIEHIVQDAGSPGIEELAREVETDFHRDGPITFSRKGADSAAYRLSIHGEADHGMYDAINRGLARSGGEICAWLNSDEQYLEGTLATVARIFQAQPDLDVLLGDALLLDASLTPVCYRRIMVPSRWHTRLDHLHSLSCAMFFRRRALPNPPLDPRWKIIGDAVLMDHFLSTGKRIRACGIPLAAYVFTGANLSSRPNLSEHDEWRAERSWPPKALRPLAVLHNRIRRLLHGAYRSFPVKTALHTKGTGSRQTVEAVVSGRWPAAARPLPTLLL